MNVRRMFPIAATLTVAAAAAVLATATALAGVYAKRAPQAMAPTDEVVSPVYLVINRDPSVPDAAMAMRGQPDARWEQQPETF